MEYGDACRTHLEERDKADRPFYYRIVIRSNIRTEIEKIIPETKKQV
jgi:hypothetical protein